MLLFGNYLMAHSRLYGVPATVKRISEGRLYWPAGRTRIDAVSRKLDWWWKWTPWLFIGKNQKCLVRGLVLFFYAKRQEEEVVLTFGAKPDTSSNDLQWHCWLTIDGRIQYEVDEEILKYTPVLSYN